eukprot:313854-Rhodomonas_salina.2
MWMDGVDIDNGIMKVKNRELVMLRRPDRPALAVRCPVGFAVCVRACYSMSGADIVLCRHQMDLIYQGLLGEWWRFSTGILGKHWDLFLCMVRIPLGHVMSPAVWSCFGHVTGGLVMSRLYSAHVSNAQTSRVSISGLSVVSARR